MSLALELSTENASKKTEMVAANLSYGNSIEEVFILVCWKSFLNVSRKNWKWCLEFDIVLLSIWNKNRIVPVAFNIKYNNQNHVHTHI